MNACAVCGAQHADGGTEATIAAGRALAAQARQLPAAASFGADVVEPLALSIGGPGGWGERFPPCIWARLGAGAALAAGAGEALAEGAAPKAAHSARHFGGACPLLAVLNDCAPILRAALRAVQDATLAEGVPGSSAAEKVLVLELASGPGLLAMLLSELLPPERVERCVLADKGWPYGGGAEAERARAHLQHPGWRIPLVARRADLRNGSHLRDLHRRVIAPAGGPAVVVGAHPCGGAALRCVQFFNANPRVLLLGLKPCCPGITSESARRKAVYSLGSHCFSSQQVLDGEGPWQQAAEGEAPEGEGEAAGGEAVEDGASDEPAQGQGAGEGRAEDGAAVAARQRRRQQLSAWAGHLLHGCDCARSCQTTRAVVPWRAEWGTGGGGGWGVPRAWQNEDAEDGACEGARHFGVCVVASRLGGGDRLMLSREAWSEVEARAVARQDGKAEQAGAEGGADGGGGGGEGGCGGEGEGGARGAAACDASRGGEGALAVARLSPYAPTVLYSRAQLRHISQRAANYIACSFLSSSASASVSVRAPEAEGAAAAGAAAAGPRGGSGPFRLLLSAVARTAQSAGNAGDSGGGGECVWVAVVPSSPKRFAAGGYAAQHYLRDLPSKHTLCYELAELVPSVGGTGGGGGDGGGGGGGAGAYETGARFAYIAFGPTKYGVKSDADNAQRLRGGGAGAAGAVFPFLVPGRHFDLVQVDRIGVKKGWRGRGAKELLLGLGAAFCADGYPVRIKTAEAAVRNSFARCSLLALEGYQDRPSKSRGRVGRGGWVFWFTGCATTHPVTGERYGYQQSGEEAMGVGGAKLGAVVPRAALRASIGVGGGACSRGSASGGEAGASGSAATATSKVPNQSNDAAAASLTAPDQSSAAAASPPPAAPETSVALRDGSNRGARADGGGERGGGERGSWVVVAGVQAHA